MGKMIRSLWGRILLELIIIGAAVAAVLWFALGHGLDAASVPGGAAAGTAPQDAADSGAVPEPHAISELAVSVQQKRENELVFSFSPQDFIDSYNGYYWADKEATGLRPLDEWEHSWFESTAHSAYGTDVYTFRTDTDNFNDPAVSIYTPEGEGGVQQVVLRFPEHSYTEQGYHRFVTQCSYAFRTFFPDWDSEQVSALYETLFDAAYTEGCQIPNMDRPHVTALYYREGRGIYPYMQAGVICFCIVPLTERYLETLTAQGAAVQALE